MVPQPDNSQCSRQFTIPERNRAIRNAHEKGFMDQEGVRRWLAWGKTILEGWSLTAFRGSLVRAKELPPTNFGYTARLS